MPRSRSTPNMRAHKRSRDDDGQADAGAKRSRRLAGTGSDAPEEGRSNRASGSRVRQHGRDDLDARDHRMQGRERGQQDGRRYAETYTALCEFVEALQCPLCSQLMAKPSTFSTCGHTFCFDCVIETLEGKGIRWPGCPTCKQPGCRKDLKTNHLIGNAVGQVRRMMEDLARTTVAERRRVGALRQSGRLKTSEGNQKTEKGKVDLFDAIGSVEDVERISDVGGPDHHVSESIEVVIGDGTDDQVLHAVEQTEVPGLASLSSQGLLEHGKLEAEVELLRAAIEWSYVLPVARVSSRDNGAATPRPKGSTEHLVVRQDSPREASVVPDSQDSEPGDVLVSKRVLKERQQNVPGDGDSQDPSPSRKAERTHSHKAETQTHAGRPEQGARFKTVKGAASSVPETSPTRPSARAQKPQKKSLAAWWKEKHRHAGAAGDEKGMRIVVDARTIADDPTVITLVEKFQSKYRDTVKMEDEISAETTHFVVSMDARSVTKLTVEYLEACAVGCWVIAPSWLEDSLQHSPEIVEEKYYAAQGHMRDDGTTHLGLPENSRTKAMAGKKVFLGQYFVLAPGAKRTDQLMRLVEFAGGTFCDVDETGSPVIEPQPATQTQASQKKMTCVVDSKMLSSMSTEQKERLLALQEGGRVAVVNERWLYASVEKGQAQLRNDGFYVV